MQDIIDIKSEVHTRIFYTQASLLALPGLELFKINPTHLEVLMQQLKGVDHSSSLKAKCSLVYLALAWDWGAEVLFLALLSVSPAHSFPLCKYTYLLQESFKTSGGKSWESCRNEEPAWHWKKSVILNFCTNI